jgi:hypothetical protein
VTENKQSGTSEAQEGTGPRKRWLGRAIGSAATTFVAGLGVLVAFSGNTAAQHGNQDADFRRELAATPQQLESHSMATRLQAVDTMADVIAHTTSNQLVRGAVDQLTLLVRRERPARRHSSEVEPACSTAPPADVQAALTTLGSKTTEHTTVDLRNTDLTNIDLTQGPYLEGAKLDGADLHCANVIRVDFRHSSLIGANLTDIQDFATDFAGATLTGALVNDSRFCVDGHVKADATHQSMHYVCVRKP